MGDGSPEEPLRQLADLIAEHNRIAAKMTALIGRPAIIGHIGEFIASKVFDIRLEASAVNKGFDGRFAVDPLKDATVDVKFYAKQEGILAIREDAVPDYFLVLTGPRVAPATSKGEVRPWFIEFVYLLDGPRLAEEVRARGVEFGVATSVRQMTWTAAEIYPAARNPTLKLTDRQRALLALFRGPPEDEAARWRIQARGDVDRAGPGPSGG